LWPAHYLDGQLRATGRASDRLYGHELSSFLRDYHRMTLQRNLPATVVRFQIANWVTMRKTQAHIYILVKELADMAHHIFDFQLFQYTNMSIRVSQSLIEKSRAGYLDLRQEYWTTKRPVIAT
jgi:hypothetical protein